MPPISLYKIGEVYFVRDGHHRVSVARALGRTEIDAYVVEVRTRVGADRTLHMDDLPKKSHERVFYERVPLPSRARGRIAVTDAWTTASWPRRRGVGLPPHADRAEFLDRATAARLWFDDEYVPVVEMLREATCSATARRPTPTCASPTSATASCARRTRASTSSLHSCVRMRR